jgi:quercetin dioxygenase-like cupin family protein
MYPRFLAISILAATAFAAPAVGGEATEPVEPALAIAFDDPSLTWGPCPAFLPEGCAIAVLHGDPAANNADVFFRVPGGSTLPLHWHNSAERMVLISGRLRVSYEGQPSVLLRPGMYAYGPPKRPHTGFCEEGEACVLFIGFESPVDAMPIDAASMQEAASNAEDIAEIAP